jgi:hypothetical protein
MHEHGFRRRSVRAQAPFLRDLWIAAWERAADLEPRSG